LKVEFHKGLLFEPYKIVLL